MDGAAWLARARWRRSGAWLWPAFVAATALDAVVGHELPPAGDGETVYGAAILACLLNLIAVLLLSRPLGAVFKAMRPDLPSVVSRDYGGTMAVAIVALGILGVGLAHRSSMQAEQRAQADAIVRAQAWIGDRAPAEFRRHLALVSTMAIQPGSIYRECVIGTRPTHTYCVIVKLGLPFARSVTFAGHEPNAVLGAGTN